MKIKKLLLPLLVLIFLAGCVTAPASVSTQPPTGAPPVSVTPTSPAISAPTASPALPTATPAPVSLGEAEHLENPGGSAPGGASAAPVLGIDQFALNGIPSNIEAMHAKYDFGWYQISNMLSVNVMARTAWPVYAKYYGGYAYFNPVPADGNWFYQDWNLYVDESARLFVATMNGNYGGTPPMVDVEQPIADSVLARLFPGEPYANQVYKGKQLYQNELKLFLETVEKLTGKIPIIYTGRSFWEDVVGGAGASWAARYGLCVANYPYDAYYSQDAYLAAIQGIMNGTLNLPAIPVPKPWAQANYIQFTGRAPASLIPGYASGKNWATTADINVLVPTAPTAPTYRVLAGYNPYVRAVDSSAGTILGVMYAGSVINVDTIDKATGYAHFQPTSAFKGGGWVWFLYLAEAKP